MASESSPQAIKWLFHVLGSPCMTTMLLVACTSTILTTSNCFALIYSAIGRCAQHDLDAQAGVGELVEQFRGWRTRRAILHLDDGFLELGHLSPLELFELDDISRTSRNTIETPSHFCCLWPPLSLTWRALQINVVCLQASLLQALHVKLASNAFLLLVCHQFCVHNLCCFGCS